MNIETIFSACPYFTTMSTAAVAMVAANHEFSWSRHYS